MRARIPFGIIGIQDKPFGQLRDKQIGNVFR